MIYTGTLYLPIDQFKKAFVNEDIKFLEEN